MCEAPDSVRLLETLRGGQGPRSDQLTGRDREAARQLRGPGPDRGREPRSHGGVTKPAVGPGVDPSLLQPSLGHQEMPKA